MTACLRALFTFFLFWGLTSYLTGQDNYASNITTDISAGEKMLITYDIRSQNPNDLFDVTLTLSYKGQPVSYNSAFGDFGGSITAGHQKAIVWYYKNDFEGEVSDIKVEISARLIPAPLAAFKYEIIGSKPPFRVVFNNLSQNASSYSWNFDDPGSGPGNFSTLENPEHIYLRARIYSVSLVAAEGSGGRADSVKTDIRFNTGELPVADFKYSMSSKSAPTTAWFKSSSANADEYHWDFGDPASGNDNYSAKKNPVHIYNQPGNYRVVLTVTNKTSMESHSHTENIIVNGS